MGIGEIIGPPSNLGSHLSNALGDAGENAKVRSVIRCF